MMTSYLDKLFNGTIIAMANIAIIVLAEFSGGGTFFDKTGLIHAIVAPFVFLILIRIFSEYAFGDFILKGFLRIQLGFFLFLGIIHLYEYLGLYVLMINDAVVESTATLSYLLWLIGNVVALEFVFRIYQKKTATHLALLTTAATVVGSSIIALHFFGGVIEEVPEWIHRIVLGLVVAFGAISIWRTLKLKGLMPVFGTYATYAVPAIILTVLATFSEYSESEGFLKQIGIPDPQNLYLSHFLIYAALSLLFIAYGKLKRPDGIYRDM